MKTQSVPIKNNINGKYPQSGGVYNLYNPYFYNNTNILHLTQKTHEQLSLWSFYQSVLPSGQGAVFLGETLPSVFDHIPFDPTALFRCPSLSAISDEAEFFAPSPFPSCLFKNGMSGNLGQPSWLDASESHFVMSRFPP